MKQKIVAYNMKQKTYNVTPINSIEEVRSEYNWIYSYITDTTVPLKKEEGVKEVQIIKYDKTMTTDEILADFKEKGLQPASPNTLLGFAHQHFDVLEKYQWLTAPSSAFRDEYGDRCFLYVGRFVGLRELCLVYLGGHWSAGYGWVFLAEVSSAPDTETLESLDTLTLDSAIKTAKEAGKVIRESEKRNI